MAEKIYKQHLKLLLNRYLSVPKDEKSRYLEGIWLYVSKKVDILPICTKLQKQYETSEIVKNQGVFKRLIKHLINEDIEKIEGYNFRSHWSEECNEILIAINYSALSKYLFNTQFKDEKLKGYFTIEMENGEILTVPYIDPISTRRTRRKPKPKRIAKFKFATKMTNPPIQISRNDPQNDTIQISRNDSQNDTIQISRNDPQNDTIQVTRNDPQNDTIQDSEDDTWVNNIHYSEDDTWDNTIHYSEDDTWDNTIHYSEDDTIQFSEDGTRDNNIQFSEDDTRPIFENDFDLF